MTSPVAAVTESLFLVFLPVFVVCFFGRHQRGVESCDWSR